MQLLNRDSRKTPVGLPFLAAGPCGPPINFLRRTVRKPLLSILGLAIPVNIGPVALNAVARASLILIQLFFGLRQLGLTIFQIFGR